MENIHPNQSTIYDFLDREVNDCKHSMLDLNFSDIDDVYCCNEECSKCGNIIYQSDCQNCNYFESNQK